MDRAKCFLCKQAFPLLPNDFRCLELRYNPDARLVCDRCGQMVKREAIIVSGIDPDRKTPEQKDHKDAEEKRVNRDQDSERI
ncbi:MAG: hypothetical protein ACM3QZ_00450 [Solirubrobacterales bacterium]